MSENNENKVQNVFVKSRWDGLAVAGLLISDTSQGRMAIFSLLCSASSGRFSPVGGLGLPDLARLGGAMAERRAAERELRPIVGELLHFARSGPGGVPVRETAQGSVPAVAVIKKVSKKDWEFAVASGQALFNAAESTFAPNLRGRASETLNVCYQPGDIDAPELREFAAHVERQILTFQSARKNVEGELRRGLRS